MLVGLISYSICLVSFAILFLVLWSDRHRGTTKNLFLFSVLTTGIWSAVYIYQLLSTNNTVVSDTVEVIKYLAWILLLAKLLGTTQGAIFIFTKTRIITTAMIILIVLLILSPIYKYLDATSVDGSTEYGSIHTIFLLFTVTGIVLLEQLYRNTVYEKKWIIKYLCLGLGSIFVFDFYLYSDALLFQKVDDQLLLARGAVYAIAVPFIGVTIARDPLWTPDIFISRRAIFHTTTLLTSGFYLLFMGVAGYYVRDYGGNWGTVAQSLFIFTSILLLAIVITSRRLRARLRVLLNKHFYPYKYDYREEWLRFIKILSSSNPDNLYKKTIISVTQIIESPGGMLWLYNDSGHYINVESWGMPIINVREHAESTLPTFLANNEFVINLDEYNSDPEVYSRLGYLVLPQWLTDLNPWLIIPLTNNKKLIGYIILDHSLAQKHHFNWEDSDLLKTVARQVASNISQYLATQALAEAKQFEQYNKISTYIIHDMKNLISQLSLITKNAEKHKHNPLFVEDVLNTIGNSVSKMNKMMDAFNKSELEHDHANDQSAVEIAALCRDIVKSRKKAGVKPFPILENKTRGCTVIANKDQLTSIFGHLIQNAQDATDDDGSITINISNVANEIIIVISDTGSGMDLNFIRNDLFKPFKTTKGEKGMGIGVYEASEIIGSLGGSIKVDSEINVGTSFTVTLPCDRNM